MTSGLQVSITDPGVLTINSYIVGALTVDATTYIQFDITPSAKYGDMGYIELVAPTNYISFATSKTMCSSIYGLTGSTLYCDKVNGY